MYRKIVTKGKFHIVNNNSHYNERENEISFFLFLIFPFITTTAKNNFNFICLLFTTKTSTKKYEMKDGKT